MDLLENVLCDNKNVINGEVSDSIFIEIMSWMQ